MHRQESEGVVANLPAQTESLRACLLQPLRIFQVVLSTANCNLQTTSDNSKKQQKWKPT